ncbi:MAG: DUF502 domain-containing protein [Proteobacteria bacterium]|nr:DUF502 domain-containing protein [Pseudomonadota bacterium]MDA0992775.1 DUF502 domain-containing protein [Pseudomonadota bacterium]
MKNLRRYIIAGLLVWLPLAVTYLLLRFVVRQMDGWLDNFLTWLPDHYNPDQLLGVSLPGLGVIFTFLLLVITGMLAANFVGRAFMKGWESLLDRIPIVRAIYSAVKKFAEMVLSDKSQSFKKVLLIQYPRLGLYSLAFQTSSELGEVQERTGEDVICTFVPTTPNPTSGVIIIVPRGDVIELDMTVDEALKMIISLGVVVPSWKMSELGELPLRMPDEPKKQV